MAISAQAYFKLKRFGFDPEIILDIIGRELDDKELRPGSEAFDILWTLTLKLYNPRIALELLVDWLEMPRDLSGQLTENQTLVAQFHPELEPDHPFWWRLSEQVNRVFPNNTLSNQGNLERRLHQLRYVISSQQAQYVRRYYRNQGELDREALAKYLKGRSYSLKDLGRLHNKLKWQKNKLIFPDQRVSYNFKILINDHTEFILDSRGHFLNEVDAEIVTESGIINGASFNYGRTDIRHKQLDIAPVTSHDPSFRRKMSRGFRSPNKSRRLIWYCPKDYGQSFFNHEGIFSSKEQSLAKEIRREGKRFKQLVNKI